MSTNKLKDKTMTKTMPGNISRLLFLSLISTISLNVQSAGIIDFDADGLGDAWELHFGFDPNGPDESAGDPDADGLTNLQEFQHNLDPQVSNVGQGSGW